MVLKINKKAIAIAFLAIFAVSSISAAFIYFNKGIQIGETESLTIAIPQLEQNALLYIAADQGFFSDNGLNVTIKDYDSGVTAINALLSGEAVIAEGAEFPFVNAICNNNSISVITINDKFENDYIVGLKSPGIETVPDLKGKTIGVAKGTIAEFYLGRFLYLNDMSLEDVNIVNVVPKDFVKVVVNGTVDALVAWQPYINQIQDEVDGIVTWQVQNGQEAYGVLVCNNQWLTQHSGMVEHFLKALKEAEDYAFLHPDIAKDIVENDLNYNQSYITAVWSKHHYQLSIDQSLVTALKDEAQWMINNKFTNQTKVPNFLEYIYTDGLKLVKPDSVTVIK